MIVWILVKVTLQGSAVDIMLLGNLGEVAPVVPIFNVLPAGFKRF